MLFTLVLRHRGGDRIYEMRCPFVAEGPNARFIVLPHWDNMSRAHMIPHPVTLYWHQVDQICFVVLTSCWVPSKQQPLPFLESLVWPGKSYEPTTSHTHIDTLPTRPESFGPDSSFHWCSIVRCFSKANAIVLLFWLFPLLFLWLLFEHCYVLTFRQCSKSISYIDKDWIVPFQCDWFRLWWWRSLHGIAWFSHRFRELKPMWIQKKKQHTAAIKQKNNDIAQIKDEINQLRKGHIVDKMTDQGIFSDSVRECVVDLISQEVATDKVGSVIEAVGYHLLGQQLGKIPMSKRQFLTSLMSPNTSWRSSR